MRNDEPAFWKTQPRRWGHPRRPVIESLVVSLVLSRLDYGCATLAGVTAKYTVGH